ncbi:MAG: transcriptional regulator [Acidobacteria bacterium]|nr:transcriptional regulator [Acidobacteriota bacterium]
MPRNAEVVRQWTILKEIEAARLEGVTIDTLARLCKVTTRTIRRDLDALQEAGFPLYDDHSDHKTRWKLNGQALKRLETTFSLAELSALYFSRTLVECLAGTPFQSDLRSAFDKLEGVLTPRMRQFLDRLPTVVAVKGGAWRTPEHPKQREIVARLLEATLQHRRASMQYHSLSSRRVKTYLVDPYQLVYGQGGLYLTAYVPAYGAIRTFASERISELTLLESRFEPVEDVASDLYAHSMGIHDAPPESIEILFTPEAAPYVRERVWHPTQTIKEEPDGSMTMSLSVCNDPTLRSWILSFGRSARVMAPETLARQIRDELDRARDAYNPSRPESDINRSPSPDPRPLMRGLS